ITFKILTNDTIQITSSNNNPGLINTTATISGGNSSVRFEIQPAFEVQTSIPQQKSFNENDIVVLSNSNELIVQIKNNNFKDIKLQIFSTDGKLIIQRKFESNELKINTTNLPKGCYL